MQSMLQSIVRLSAFALLCVGLVTLFGGCGEQTSSPTHGKKGYPYKVTCTVAMVTDIVRQVAGDKAQVTGLLNEGVDPHLYKPTRDDIAALKSADVVFYSGLLLEGKMEDVLKQIEQSGKPVVAVTRGIPEAKLISPPDAAGHHDPHVWMDVTLWSDCVSEVAKSLSDYDAANAAEYKSRAEAYKEQLAGLAKYAKEVVQTIPKSRRVVVTSHDAFNYFGRAYDIEVRGIQGISTESEAGLRDLENLVKFLVDREITAVFVESSVSPKNVEALLEGAKARGRDVKIGGTLFSDAMGSAGTYEGSYFGMIDHNITTVVRALGGTAPEKGFQGKLTGVKH
jgi:manganese/zinc/iron transport system substrate-binding protein